MDPRFFRQYLDILSEQSQPPLDIAGTEYRQGGVPQLGIQPNQQDIQSREKLAGTLQTDKSLTTGGPNQITYTDPRVNSIVGDMQQDLNTVEKRLALAGVGRAPETQPTQKPDFSQYKDDDVAASPAQPTAAPAQPAQPSAADAINRVLDTQPAQPAAPTAAAKPAQPATAPQPAAPTAAAKPQPPAQPAAQTKTNSGGNVQEDTVRNQNNQQMDPRFFRRYLDILSERVVMGPDGKPQPRVQVTGPEPTDGQMGQDGDAK